MGPKKKQYPAESIRAAIQTVEDGEMSVRQAAGFHAVPYSTLKDYLKRGKSYKQVDRTVLSREQEERLVSWLEESARRGFGRKKQQILDTVQRFVKEKGITTPFKDGRPGRKWFYNFLSRHKEKLSFLAPGAKESVVADVTAEKIKDWFNRAYKEIIAVDPDLLNHPERILKCDEAGFQLAGGISRLVPPKKLYNSLHQTTHDPLKQVTVLVCVSASGEIHPPLLVFPGKRFNYDPLAGFPEAHFAKSESGWIDSEIFATWLQTAFIPAVAHLEKPVILFVDKHKSRINLDVSELCRVHNIILYQLPSLSRQLVQPLDLTTFKGLKTMWREDVMKYQKEECSTLGKRDFSYVLKKVWQRGIKKDIVISGFRAAGIYPWDPDHIDLSKLEPSRLSDPPSSMVTVTDEVPEDIFTQVDTIDNPTASYSSCLDDIGLSPLIALDRLLDVAAKVGLDRLYEFKSLNTLKLQTDDTEAQLFSLLYDSLTKMLRDRENIDISN